MLESRLGSANAERLMAAQNEVDIAEVERWSTAEGPPALTPRRARGRVNRRSGGRRP